jgi:hypothetical protein
MVNGSDKRLTVSSFGAGLLGSHDEEEPCRWSCGKLRRFDDQHDGPEQDRNDS